MTQMNRRDFTLQAGKTAVASIGGLMTLSALNSRKALLKPRARAHDRIPEVV
jgi:hypothetical protein